MLTQEDQEIIAHALSMRANWIETGDPVLSAVDLHNMKRQKDLKCLDESQMRLVLKLRDLARSFY